MIPYSYKFVDFGGTDLAEINGKVVEGVHDRIITALNQCGEVVLYNWSFAGIPIAPSYCSIEVRLESLFVNDVIEICDDDTVWVESLIPPEPDPPVLVPLNVVANGDYSPVDYNADGFNAVSVEVSPALVPLNVIANGDYSPVDYNADGFSAVSVEVPIPAGGRYREVEAGFFGLATAYQTADTSPEFRLNDRKDQCLLIANIEPGYYVVFLPEQVGTRFRAAKWPGKTVNDFLPYLDVEGATAGELVFSGATTITGSVELTGEGLTRRFFFTGINGAVVIGTSNSGQIVKPILLKIEEE